MRSHPPRNGGYDTPTQSLFMSSVQGVANVIAVAVTYFLTPLCFNRTVGFVQKFTTSQYGSGLEDLVYWAWFVMVTLFLFYVSRATVGTMLVMGGLAIAARFL